MKLTVVILAAGRSSRLQTGKPKSLLEVNGICLLERHIMNFTALGEVDFCIVTGFDSKPIEEMATVLAQKYQTSITIVHNDRYDLENGYSVGAVESWMSNRSAGEFYLTMADHLFQPEFVESFVNQISSNITKFALWLAVDKPSQINEHIDVEDVTKVMVDNDRSIIDIGKNIPDYNFYDTGLFHMKSQVFQTLRQCFDAKKYTISDMVNSLVMDVQASTIDLSGYLWNDVDNEKDFSNSLKFNF